MPKKSGRPVKDNCKIENKQLIINTAIELIKKHGADYITVRNICNAADIGTGTFYYHFKNKDDLLIYFLKEKSFDEFNLSIPIEKIDERISELYMHLINRYMNLGQDFMKSFYTTGNRSLSAYMGEVDGEFTSGTVMHRCEKELLKAKEKDIINNNADIHELSMDICTIVKGCVFEWCLTDGNMDIKSSLYRIIKMYMSSFIS